jgi:hypothetical protein
MTCQIGADLTRQQMSVCRLTEKEGRKKVRIIRVNGVIVGAHTAHWRAMSDYDPLRRQLSSYLAEAALNLGEFKADTGVDVNRGGAGSWELDEHKDSYGSPDKLSTSTRTMDLSTQPLRSPNKFLQQQQQQELSQSQVNQSQINQSNPPKDEAQILLDHHYRATLDFKVDALYQGMDAFKGRMRAELEAFQGSLDRRVRSNRKDVLEHMHEVVDTAEGDWARRLKKEVGEHQLLEIDFRKKLAGDIHAAQHSMQQQLRDQKAAVQEINRTLQFNETYFEQLRASVAELGVSGGSVVGGRRSGVGGAPEAEAEHKHVGVTLLREEMTRSHLELREGLAGSRRLAEEQALSTSRSILELRKLLESIIDSEEKNCQARDLSVAKAFADMERKHAAFVDHSLEEMHQLVRQMDAQLDSQGQMVDSLREGLQRVEERSQGLDRESLDAMEERLLKLHRVKDSAISELQSYLARLESHVQEREREGKSYIDAVQSHADMEVEAQRRASATGSSLSGQSSAAPRGSSGNGALVELRIQVETMRLRLLRVEGDDAADTRALIKDSELKVSALLAEATEKSNADRVKDLEYTEARIDKVRAEVASAKLTLAEQVVDSQKKMAAVSLSASEQLQGASEASEVDARLSSRLDRIEAEMKANAQQQEQARVAQLEGTLQGLAESQTKAIEAAMAGQLKVFSARLAQLAADSSTQLDRVQEELATEREASRRLQEQVEKLRTDHKTELAAMRENELTTTTAISAISARVDIRETQPEPIDEQKLQERLVDIESRINSIAEEAYSSPGDVAESQEAVLRQVGQQLEKSHASNLASSMKLVSNVVDNVREVETRVAVLEAGAAALSEAQDASAESQQVEVGTLREEVAALAVRVCSVEANVEDQDSVAETNVAEVAALKTDLDATNTRLEVVQTSAGELSTACGENATAVQESFASQAQTQAQLEGLEESFSAHKETFNKFRADQLFQKNGVGAVDAKLGTLVLAAKKREAKVDALEVRVADLETAAGTRVAAEEAESQRIAAEEAKAKRAAEQKAEQERIEAERVEAERIAAEHKAEQERIEAERIEAERVAAEERVEAERTEAERVEAERVEAERLAAEEKEEQDRIESERIAAEQKAEQERIEAERIENERIAAEERKEIERIEAERIENERLAAEKEEQERVEAEQKAEAESIEAQRIAAEEKAEAERLENERIEAEQTKEAERIEAERVAAELEEQERVAEAQRLAIEKAEQKRIDAERVAAEHKAEQDADDEVDEYEEEMFNSFELSFDDDEPGEEADASPAKEGEASRRAASPVQQDTLAEQEEEDAHTPIDASAPVEDLLEDSDGLELDSSDGDVKSAQQHSEREREPATPEKKRKRMEKEEEYTPVRTTYTPSRKKQPPKDEQSDDLFTDATEQEITMQTAHTDLGLSDASDFDDEDLDLDSDL